MRTLRIRGSTIAIQETALKLREAMTPTELILWDRLKDRRFHGLKFRSQHPTGRFILDFYCPVCKLAIEVDGSSHEGRAEFDRARDAKINSFGYRVVHIQADCVENRLAEVLQIIQTAANEQAKKLAISR